MKELINIVNSKIQAVVDELKNQKTMLENKLKTVEVEIEQQVEAANTCKTNVETSSNTISELEADITKLKGDLQELHDKFDSAGFTELLEAGNKEINGKIIENNTKIAEQQDLIRRYSEEAQSIKDELTALKDSKMNLETELNNTMVALKYYSKKIDDMTITAIEHADKLSDIVILDDENNEIADVDVNKVIDGTIFDEIDHISSNDRELSEQELEDILNTKEQVSEVVENKEEDLSKTQALDAAIVEAQELLENTGKMEPVQVPPQEEIVEQAPVVEEQPVETIEEPMDVIEQTPEQPSVVDVPMNDQFEDIPVNVPMKEDYQENPIINSEEFEKTMNINISTPEEPNNNVQDIKSTFADINSSSVDINGMIDELGLDPSKFEETDLNILKNNLDVQKGLKIIDVLDKHFIDTKNIYSNPEILITMSPEVLDEELDILERSGCISTTIGYVFKYLDQIDINKLREKVTGQTDAIIKVLYDCITEKESTNISEVLELSDEETRTLESNLDAKEYNIFCTFPEVVKANYDTIRNLHVAEPAKCITEHPKRFMNNPDVFDDILDKYDTPDLVRCINKNPAVIDKL
ncbi:MAG: hypothetical protein IKP76_00425 [Bacilli bacterium]|nr:hypothetical protein [Bacilli bacterium]